MINQGIYTLANDTVYDQLIALLNSIEINIGSTIPICVIPYNDNLVKVKQEIAIRDNVKLFENQESLAKWDQFFNSIWEAHPRAKQSKFLRPPWYKGFVHRKFASFDGDFAKFVFFDADTLAMKPLDNIFEKLNTYDLVFDDWEHNKPRESTEISIDKIEQNSNLTETEIRPKIHCDSFFGSKRGFFTAQDLEILKKRLVEKNEIEWVKEKCWWSTSAMFSYLTFHNNFSMFNFTLSSDSQDRTGNCADSDPFINVDNVLYNKQGLKPIHRIHYMNYSASDFTNLCQGEDVDICYKDIFLHYRFLHNLNQKPKVLIAPKKLKLTSRKIKQAIDSMFIFYVCY